MFDYSPPKNLPSILSETSVASHGSILAAVDGGIERKRLLELLDPQPSRWALEVVYKTGSTNADLAAQLKAARWIPFNPRVRVAYSQTAGRGRRSRPWLDSPGNALLFSLAHLMPRTPDRLAGLSLALGATIVEGLRTLPLDDSRRLLIKWPNDILLDGAKLAGVLVETAWSTRDSTALIVGVGLNINSVDGLAKQIASSFETFLPTFPLMPSALSSAWPNASPTPVLGAVLNALAVGLERFGQYGFGPFRDAWIAVHAYMGQEVVISGQGEEIARGIVYSVDEQGRLLIRTPQEILAIAAGDVSLRLSENVNISAQQASGVFTYEAYINELPAANTSIIGQYSSRLTTGAAPVSHLSVTTLASSSAQPATGCAHKQQLYNDDA
ncbi:biotin--[acetyl-CoA-carboxylase] ligase [Candidatus Vallotia tarda]|uniref:biotin--[biotin carboxyl-carrier protein] ligase n=1 Tax=Candidatus Vallotiella hemipterorum TaxID=1177213 RepID=A0A916JQY9_9BURK|nr:biotin--[acetyl-CoA-carboxylase] ligase [Candidatus Vallotia tarda]CAG7596048.1 Biotin operon repressor / Biotin--[acetyl-CoA-carboxylase] synthetase [Candidatus Vallotia tarda]